MLIGQARTYPQLVALGGGSAGSTINVFRVSLPDISLSDSQRGIPITKKRRFDQLANANATWFLPIQRPTAQKFKDIPDSEMSTILVATDTVQTRVSRHRRDIVAHTRSTLCQPKRHRSRLLAWKSLQSTSVHSSSAPASCTFRPPRFSCLIKVSILPALQGNPDTQMERSSRSSAQLPTSRPSSAHLSRTPMSSSDEQTSPSHSSSATRWDVPSPRQS